MLVAIAVVAALTSRAPLPAQVATPSMPGTTLLAYERMRDLNVRPGDVTYQPEGYTVYQPRGRTVAVALRCVGEGRVRISAGERFDFRCDDRERVLRAKAAAPRNGPFIVMGTTIGDVVWSARIVLLDPQQVSGAIPDFRSPCSSCSVVEE